MVIYYGQHHTLPSGLTYAIIAGKLLREGCMRYLAHVIYTRVSELRLEDVLVVKDFLDVFPDELLGFNQLQ